MLDLTMHIQGSNSGPSYDKYAAALHRQTELKDEQLTLQNTLKLLEQLLTHFLVSGGVLSTTTPLFLDLVKEIQETNNRLQSIVSHTHIPVGH